MVKRLDEKVAIITGGGQGVGYGIAQALADEGANLVITGRNKAKLDTAATGQTINVDGGQAML